MPTTYFPSRGKFRNKRTTRRERRERNGSLSLSREAFSAFCPFYVSLRNCKLIHARRSRRKKSSNWTCCYWRHKLFFPSPLRVWTACSFPANVPFTQKKRPKENNRRKKPANTTKEKYLWATRTIDLQRHEWLEKNIFCCRVVSDKQLADT